MKTRTVYVKKCMICGTQIEGAKQKKYCKDCAKKIQKEQEKHWKSLPENQIRLKKYMNQYMHNYLQDPQKHKKHKIRLLTNSKLKSGKLAMACKCGYPGCNETENLEKHHVAYDVKHAEYFFITYCHKHHKLVHKMQKQDIHC